ncbi:hypothetical protein B0A52_08635 [Exophiala mesophila]|uniref:BZIP domain-containing protein n=1 Tax=Exophiala mesophila TaxID=212818 RepID=A0A438MTZ4_EXOME|nr:hypothetical protein B0A52_08635 [Exophiala mesophila]
MGQPPLNLDFFQPPPPLPAEDLIQGHDISIDFPEQFFLNPFAVSFPGDLPCSMPLTIDSATDTLAMASPTTSPALSSSMSFPVSDGKELNVQPSPFTDKNTPRSTSTSDLDSRPAGVRGVVKAKPSKPSTTYRNEIQFVDMADKKGAQRIRNTMNSRRHRQNKLDKIRELEQKLEALEAEKDKWQSRAMGNGSVF